MVEGLNVLWLHRKPFVFGCWPWWSTQPTDCLLRSHAMLFQCRYNATVSHYRIKAVATTDVIPYRDDGTIWKQEREKEKGGGGGGGRAQQLLTASLSYRFLQVSTWE